MPTLWPRKRQKQPAHSQIDIYIFQLCQLLFSLCFGMPLDWTRSRSHTTISNKINRSNFCLSSFCLLRISLNRISNVLLCFFFFFFIVFFSAIRSFYFISFGFACDLMSSVIVMYMCFSSVVPILLYTIEIAAIVLHCTRWRF